MTTLAERVEAARDQVVLAGDVASPASLFDAVGELAMAIKPHHMDANQRKRIAAAIGVLVDHIITAAALRARESKP